MLTNHLNSFKADRIVWMRVHEAAKGLSQADLARAADEVIKDSILKDTKAVTTESLVAALNERRAVRETVSGITDM